jgi:magnesium chelatase family protein
MGELSLDGGITAHKRSPAYSNSGQEAAGFKGFILPKDNSREAAIVSELTVYGMSNLMEVVAFFNGTEKPERVFVNQPMTFCSM